MTVYDIYKKFDEIAPFSLAESWDNCGLLTGNFNNKVEKILICLDITKRVALEAIEGKYDLVIAHHPVIFAKLSRLDDENVAVLLCKNGISAICAHTNLDIVKGGINDIMVDLIGEDLTFEISSEPLEFTQVVDGVRMGIGKVLTLENEISTTDFAQLLKEKFGCKIVRFNDTKKMLKKIGISCGYGGDRIYRAIGKNCDAMVCGDVKHEQFIDADNANVAVFDAGHYYTENIVVSRLKAEFQKAFPEVKIDIAKENADLVSVL